MPRSDYTGPDHTSKVVNALNGFHRALTRRWRSLVADAIVSNSWDFPTAIKRETAPPEHTPALWNFSSLPARYHVERTIGYCGYLMWVWNGQDGPLSAVSCGGYTGVSDERAALDANGRSVTIPEHIECGVGTILARVEDWAWGERLRVFNRLPLFDGLDLDKIQQAHDALVELGGRLGLEAGGGSETGILGPFTAQPAESRPIPMLVDNIADENKPAAGRRNWWTGWTGLQASWAKAGFFASVVPSMNNQAGIAGSLANLVSYRAAIIEKGRNDALYWVEWATESLDETKEEITDYTSGWKVVQGLGMGAMVAVGWNPAGAVLASEVILVGFLGEQLFPEGPKRESPLHDMVQVVETLHDKITILDLGSLAELEGDYYSTVNRLEGLIYDTHSYNLELYDFLQNRPAGDPDIDDAGFQANVESILGIANDCYKLGAAYEELLPVLARTSDGDRHLADKDGNQTRADNRLRELRDLLESFLKTTIGRYLVAGDQVRDAARAYVEDDEEQRQRFNDMNRDLEGYDVGFDPDDYAEETERLGRPGEDDDKIEYEVEDRE